MAGRVGSLVERGIVMTAGVGRARGFIARRPLTRPVVQSQGHATITMMMKKKNDNGTSGRWLEWIVGAGAVIGGLGVIVTGMKSVENDAAADGAEKIVQKVTESEEKEETAFNEETGEINWDCPCLGGMAHGPCGEEFKAAFSCFIYSKEEQKGIDCLEQFKSMQDCFRKHPEVYGEEIADDEDSQSAHESGVEATRSGEAPPSPSTEQGDTSLSKGQIDQAGQGKPDPAKKQGSEGNRKKQSDAKAKFENEGKSKTRGGPHVDSQAAAAGASKTLNHSKHQGDIDVHEERDAGGNPQLNKGVGSKN